MQQLTELAIWTRSKAGRAFGPQTLRGYRPSEPDARLAQLTPQERVERALSEAWAPVLTIADRTGVEERKVSQICRRLVEQGMAEVSRPQRVNAPVLYRRHSQESRIAA